MDRSMTWRSLILGVLVAAFAAMPVAAQSPVVGVASVIDGDTLEIHGKRIRLHGIDAPESGQFCEKDGKQYRCGQQAALALSEKIGRASIRCEQRDIDRYKRIVAVCRLNDIDLNSWMVRQGYAVAYRRYSMDYVTVEEVARSERRGVWAGEFTLPWLWRRGQRR
jgi:endonuclease YncB( thermonuclease family)